MPQKRVEVRRVVVSVSAHTEAVFAAHAARIQCCSEKVDMLLVKSSPIFGAASLRLSLPRIPDLISKRIPIVLFNALLSHAAVSPTLHAREISRFAS